MAPKLPGKWPYFGADLKDGAISGSVEVCLLEGKMATKKPRCGLKFFAWAVLLDIFFRVSWLVAYVKREFFNWFFAP